MKKDLVVFIDCGDTIVDESTQVFAPNGDVLRAQPIPGADTALRELHKAGFRLALVADGRTTSFRNILEGNKLYDLFEVMVISEEEGVSKPHPQMFEEAMARMGLTAADASRIVMVGNNLKRDVLGANRMGIISILLSFSPRYVMRPDSEEETPDYVISMPCQLPPLLEQLDLQVQNRRILAAAPPETAKPQP